MSVGNITAVLAGVMELRIQKFFTYSGCKIFYKQLGLMCGYLKYWLIIGQTIPNTILKFQRLIYNLQNILSSAKASRNFRIGMMAKLQSLDWDYLISRKPIFNTGRPVRSIYPSAPARASETQWSADIISL